MDNESRKMYPASSEEMAKFLGLSREEKPLETGPVMATLPTGIVTLEKEIPVDTTEITSEETVAGLTSDRGYFYAVLRVTTGVLPYLAVFAVAFVAYYFFFTGNADKFNFGKTEISAEEQAKLDKQAEFETLKQERDEDYIAWISQFYFEVSDSKVIDPDAIAPNGLTNFENYLLQLNPKSFSMLQTDKSDAQNLLDGIDPKTGKDLTDVERNIIAKYFDLALIQQRIKYTPEPKVGSAQRVAQDIILPATVEVDNSIPGRLEVPNINLNVPIIWSQSEQDLDNDLLKGIVHYPGTPYPGHVGTSYISGHSSNYAWVKADFNKVFERIDELPVGSTFKVTVVGKNGKNIWLHYVVVSKKEFKADDQAQFENTAESIVALSTCWPVGTLDRRLVAFGKLSRIEYE